MVARCRHICNTHDLKDLINLICLGHVSVHGLDRPGMLVDEKIMYVGRITWLNGCGNNDRAQEYVSSKQYPMHENMLMGV